MKIDAKALLDAIERYIAKADDDLEETLTAEGYVEAAKAVKAVNKLEESISEALETDADAFLERIQSATGVDNFIEDIWPDIKTAENLRDELKEIFRKQFDDMLRQFTYHWIVSEEPAFSVIDDNRITKPAEDFIRRWSGDLADIMHLNTKNAMERILLDAQEKGWSIDEVSDAIAESGIRQVGYRSRTVALTEVLRVESYAQQESMVQNPLAYKKKWRHVMSAHPRENHQAIDGQEVFKRETFTLTGKDGGIYYPMCPRDTSLPASETINCHCLMDVIANERAIDMTDAELISLREKYMDEVDAEWEEKQKEAETA